MIWFTADEHYGHTNIIKYCKRPFKVYTEMNETLIANHNALVQEKDFVYHLGDFTLDTDAYRYIKRLNGEHIFLRGSHDRWMKPSSRDPYLIETTIESQPVVLCHYAMRRWSRSHYGAWQLYGHSHGRLEPVGKQWDVGVDNNGFCPVSFNQLKVIMAKQPNNEDHIPGQVQD